MTCLRLLLIYFSFVFATWAGAQNINPYVPLVKSPDVASINKFQESPVNIGTGLQQINIPIYTITQGNYSLPVSLNYHSGGIRVDELASSVGLGWALNAGGVISRTVRKEPDESGGGYYPNGWRNPRTLWCYNPPGCTPTSCNTGDPYITSADDTEPDIFSFSFDKYSGKFLFDKFGKAHLIPEQDLKIEWPNSATFIITTPEGTKYTFGLPDLSKTYGVYVTQDQAISSWHLLQVIASTGDEINFEYVQQGFQIQQVEPENYNAHNCNDILKYITIMQTSQDIYMVKKISSNICEVRFNYKTSPREDIKPISAAAFALDNIQVYSKIDNQVIRRYNLTTSYFETTGIGGTVNYHMTVPGYLSKRLRLDAITECDVNNVCLPAYSFSYNKYNTVPNLPNILSTGRDHWGFYNGQNENQTLVTNPGFSSFSYLSTCTGLANREVNSSYQKAFILDEIIFPTGGVTKFMYEGCYSTQFNRNIGGLRLSSVTNDPKNNQPVVQKTYEYGTPYLTGGPPIYEQNIPAPGAVSTYGYCTGPYGAGNPNPCLQGGGTHFMAMSNPISFAAELGGHYVMYDMVKEKQPGNGWIENYYEVNALSNEIDYEYASDFPYIARYPLLMSGKLLSSVTKNEFGNVVRQENYTYMNYRRYAVKPGDALRIGSGNCFPEVLPYFLMTGATYLKQLEIIQDGMTTNTFYEYDDIPATVDLDYNGDISFMPNRIIETTSEGKTQVSEFKYAKQYGNYGFINTLLTKNMRGVPIEKKITIDGNVISGSVNTYRVDNGLPDRIYTFEATGPVTPANYTTSTMSASGIFSMDNHYKLKILNNEYDNAHNLVEIQKAGDLLKSIIWDYNGTYPVAEIQGSGLTEVAYTSFESDSKGYWDFNSGGITANSTAPTGKNCYTLTGNTISRSNISSLPDMPHVVSYWSNSGQYTVIPSQSVKVGRTVNGWTHYEHLVTGYSTVQITGSGLIDEVRLHLAKSLMTTRTFIPLIGISSECNPNNQITYFEFDKFARLVLVRDQDRLVKKKYCYNYAGQIENCLHCTDINPVWQNTATPLRCQVLSCGTTGYQEQEQIDINPCSPTSGSTRWILGPYNPGVCPVTAGVTINYQNGIAGHAGGGFVALYTNNVTGLVYSFNVPMYGNGILGCLPDGTYSLSIAKSGSSLYINFGTGCAYQAGTSAYFGKVRVGPPYNCNMVILSNSFE